MTSLNVMVISLVACKGLGQLEPDIWSVVWQVLMVIAILKKHRIPPYTCSFLASIN